MILYTNCDVRNKLANKISRQRYKRTCITFLKVLSHNAIKIRFIGTSSRGFWFL